jgi:hypothetical protein
MRALGWLSLGGLVVLAACAEAPLQPSAAPGTTVRAVPDEATAAAIAEHRQLAQK